MTVLLQFSKSSAPYNAGEVAGFDPEVAKLYLARGVAVKLTKAPPITPPGTSGEESLVSVRFVKSQPPYRAGEVAGFSQSQAGRYVESGVGELVDHAKAARSAARAAGPAEGSMEPPPLVSVLFLKSAFGHRKGEVAGFDPEVAKQMVKDGVAKYPGEDDEPLAADAASGDPSPDSVSPDVEVSGLDDRDPDWRERKKDAPAQADKMQRGSPKQKGK